MAKQLSENAIGGSCDWRVFLAQTFARSGPWAVLLVIVLGAVWYETDKWMGSYMAAQERYIAQSSENIVTLQRSTQLLSEVVTRNTERMAGMSDDVRLNQKYLMATTQLMENAAGMMKDAPDRAKKTLDVLERIEVLLRTIEKNGSGG